MNLNWLLTWWNAIYTLPLAVVLVFLMVTSLVSLAGGTFGEGGSHDADAHHDGDHGGDHEGAVDHGADGDSDHDLDADADGHDGGRHHVGDSVVTPALVALGAGRMPLLMLLQVLLLFWGLTGTLLHQAVGVTGRGFREH